MTIKLGAVGLSYAATAVVEERDEEAGTVRIEAQGRETKGKGRASATINSTLEEAGERTKVAMHTDLKISGPAARYGRGMMEDVSKRLTGQFADCLKATIETAEPEAAPAPPPEGSDPSGGRPADVSPAPAEPVAAKPVGGFRLAAWAIGKAILRAVGRIVAAIRARISGR